MVKLSFNWNDRRVLVTGATGFIGSWLTESLVEKGANVTVLVKKGDPLSHGGITKFSDKLKIIYSDIRDSEGVKSAVKDQEVVFHLAAITQVPYVVKHPVESAEVDIFGAINILEAARNSNQDAFIVYASTDKVYGEPKYVPIDENHSLIAKSPYDASKLAADRMTYAYYATYGLKSAITRWSNTIGGRDANILRAVPDFVTSIHEGNPPTIRYSGNNIRDFIFVTDAVDGMLATVENQNVSTGEAFNLGTGRPTTIFNLANLLIKMMGFENKMSPVILNKPEPGEIKAQYLSSEKAGKLLKWSPKISLEEGLRLSIKWYWENKWWFEIMNNVSSFYGLRTVDVSRITSP